MGRQTCPECGSVATADVTEDFDTGLICPNGHGELTEEGLLLKPSRGRDGVEIFSETGKDGIASVPSGASEDGSGSITTTFPLWATRRF